MSNSVAPVDITIGKDYDSKMCGSIPLHLVNLIQPHGLLLVLDKKEMRILQVSENVEQLLRVAPEDLLEQPISKYVPAKQYEELVNKIGMQQHQDKIPYTLHFEIDGKEVAFSAIVLPHPDYIIIELEENKPSEQESFVSLYQHIKYITAQLKQASTLKDIAQLAAQELKRFSGFDKVLVYQFDPQWNGIVIAQAKEEDMADYMDLRFPASDVPKQARELYFKNPYRLIPCRDYTPVRLIPVINPATQQFTDLSDASLRSVARVHLEYMANLKINASMSLPLIIDNKLWGLISCHNKTPKYPSYELRSAMELLSGILSAQLQARVKEEDMVLRVRLRGVHGQLMEQLYTAPNFADSLLEGKATVQDLLSLSGAALLLDGNIWRSGTTPDEQELKELVSWLRRNHPQGLFATATLPQVYPRSKEYKTAASGLIALPINGEQNEYILGFRPEVLQTVNWGGNPNEAIQLEPDGKGYHPRNSFAIYQEIVKNTSLPWRQEELEAAEALRSAILEKVIRDRH